MPCLVDLTPRRPRKKFPSNVVSFNTPGRRWDPGGLGLEGGPGRTPDPLVDDLGVFTAQANPRTSDMFQGVAHVLRQHTRHRVFSGSGERSKGSGLTQTTNPLAS